MKYILLSLTLISTSIYGGGFGSSQGQAQGQLQGQLQGQRQGQGQRQMSRNTNHNTAIGIGFAGAVSGSYSDGSRANNSMTLKQNYSNPDDIRIKNTPDAYSPALTTSQGTCMGSASAGGSGPGIGLSFGSTYQDEECNIRYTVELVNNLGYPKEALKVLCTSPTLIKAKTGLCGQPKIKNKDIKNGFF